MADKVKSDVRNYIGQLKKEGKRLPHLVVILIGSNPASQAYVKGKGRDCEEVGIQNTTLRYDDISEQELLEKIEALNGDVAVDGILVQLKTKNIIEEARQADIIVSAMGQARLVKKEWIKEGAVVIDVGMNRDDQGKLCGDVDLEDVIDRVSYITPVPKGVGLITRAMLLENTIEAYQGGV